MCSLSVSNATRCPRQEYALWQVPTNLSMYAESSSSMPFLWLGEKGSLLDKRGFSVSERASDDIG